MALHSLNFVEYLIVLVTYRENNISGEKELFLRFVGEPQTEEEAKLFAKVTPQNVANAIQNLQDRGLLEFNSRFKNCYSLTEMGIEIGRDIDDRRRSVTFPSP